MTTKTTSSQRKPYARPTLKAVDLTADEVLAVGCKMQSSGMNPGISPCALGSCAQPGDS